MTAIGFRKSMFKINQQGTFWLSPTPEEVGSQGWDAALPRIASWLKLSLREESRQILIVNTHFDHRGSTARRESALLLRTWIAANRDDDLPVILTGDLNAQVPDAPLQALLARSSSDAPELLDAKSAPGIKDRGPDSTWNGFREIAQGRRLDHILYRGNLHVLDYQTLDPRTKEGRFASDHMPVKAALRFSAP